MNIPIWSFLRRTWLLIVLGAVFVAACLNDALFTRFGALIYVPAVASIAILLTMLFIHIFFRETIDKEEHDGTYLKEWRELDARTRVILTVAIRVAFFIGICLIASSIGK